MTYDLLDQVDQHLAAALQIAHDDPASFAAIANRLYAAVDGLPAAAQAIVARPGYSWRSIGDALGIRRTSAHEHYGPSARRRRSGPPRPIDGQTDLLDQVAQ